MDELTIKRKDKVIKGHLKQFDIIMKQFIEELGDIEITPEMINDLYKLSLDKWAFLHKYKLIKEK